MTRSPNPFLVVALLVSIFVHLFLVDQAIDLTFRLQLFSTSTGDQLFRIRQLDIRRAPEIPAGRPQWLPQELISLGPPKEVVEERTGADEAVLLESEKFISSDVTEQKLLESIERAIAAEAVAKAEETAPAPAAESAIPQEVLAVDASLLKREIPRSQPRISATVERGTATSDIIFFTEAGPLAEPVPGAITKGPTGKTPVPGSPSEKQAMAKLAMADRGAAIPGVISPPPLVADKERVLESADLVDTVTVDYEKIQKYPPLDDMLTVQLFTYHRPGEAKGYFRLVVEPRKDRKDIKAIPKDIIFVVDSSQSITQRKLDYYIQGLKLCLPSLSSQDRFNIIEFKDFTRKLSDPDVVPAAPDMLAKGEAFLSGLISEGGTNVYKSLTELVALPPSPGRPRIIFMVSDGRPTAGIRQDSEIINQVTALNNLKASIFTFAGGAKINTSLLDLLSYRNRGARTFEPDDGKIPQALSNFYQEFNSPILLNPRFNFGALDAAQVYPKILPDLYLNGRLEILGQFEGEDEFSMQLLGEVDGQTKEYVLQQKLTGPDSGDESVARTWAFRKIYDLVGQMIQKGGSQTILSEIERLSADYKVATSYSPFRRGRSQEE